MTDEFQNTTPDQPKRMLSVPQRPLSSPANHRLPIAALANGTSFGAGDVLTFLQHWWWKCLLAGGILSIGAGILVWLTFKPVYEATAWIEIKEQPVFVAFEPRLGTGSAQMFFKTQLQMIRSPVILSKLCIDPKIVRFKESQEANSVLEWLESGLKVSFRGDSELCEISFRARQPEAAATVVNSVMAAYLTSQRDQAGQQTDRIIVLLEEERRRRITELEQFQERVRVLAKKVTGRDAIAGIGKKDVVIAQNPVAEFEARRTAVEVERVVLEAKLRSYREMGSKAIEVDPEELELALESDPAVKDLRMKLLQANSHLRDSRLRERQRKPSGDDSQRQPSGDSPTLQRLAKTVQGLEKSLEELQNELRPKFTEEVRKAKKAQLSRAVAELEANIEGQRQVERAWQDRIEEQRTKLASAGDQSADLEFALGDLERSSEVYQKIADRIIALRTEMRAPMRTNELKAATVPSQPLEAIPYKQLAVACLGSLLAPFGLAFLWERSLRRIRDARQITAQSNLQVLGEITALPARALRSGQRSSDRQMRDRLTFEESVDALRVGLTQTASFRDLRTLAVTSAISREGKSSLSYSLALSLSRCTDQPTLLIDADMRAPDLHAMCDIARDPGLAEVLGRTCAIADAIVPYAAQRIHLLPAGRLHGSPHLLLKDGAFQSLLDTLRSQYRFIVIDCPPVLAASESLVLAGAADGTLMCTMRDVSRGSQLQLASEKLIASGAVILGAVINGVPRRTWLYKYGGYEYSHNHGSTQDDPVVEP